MQVPHFCCLFDLSLGKPHEAAHYDNGVLIRSSSLLYSKTLRTDLTFLVVNIFAAIWHMICHTRYAAYLVPSIIVCTVLILTD